ncbi:MAG: GGDEF domain-containing protein [Ruminococcus flavefaciens]|nr:GGDEF domain-containing protein [Ruminococcus flavefaciens]
MNEGFINEEMYSLGNVIIDGSFHTQRADETFFRYFGNDVVYSIKRTIDENDFSRIEECLTTASEGVPTKTVIRMKGINGSLRWTLASVRMTADTPERLFSIVFSDVFSLENLAYSHERTVLEYRHILSLTSDLAFEYSFQTKNIRIYMFDCYREIVIADRNIDEWQKEAVQSGYILSRYTDTFSSLCRDIKKGVYRFDYEFESSILTSGKNREMCLFRGITRYDDPNTKKVSGIISVVSSRQKSKDINLALEANRDSLSGVLNKRAVTSYAMEIIASKPSCRVNLVLLDIDNFSEIVNSYGHLFGDEVIFTVAGIIKTEIGARGIAGRITGAGFLIVLEDTRDETDLRGILRAIRTKTEWAFSGRSENLCITCSMGVSTYPADSSDYNELFMQADKALYIAQQKGQNRYVIYDIEKHGAVEKDIKNKIAFLSDKKETSHKLEFIGKLAENLVFGRIPDISVLLEQIRIQFDIDDICVFAGNDMNLILSCGNSSAKNASYLFRNKYTERFSGDGILAIDNVNELEGRDDNAFACLTEQNIGGAVQYLMTENSIVKGLISFCYVGRFKKWSVSDLSYMTIIGRTVTAILKKQDYI